MDFVLGCEGGSLPSTRRGQGRKSFDPGLWNHAATFASGGSQILGANRYRIYSADGSYSSVQINNSLLGKTGKLFQFRVTVESIAAGASLIMGDDVGNDITVTGVGTHTGTWVVNGPTATIKRLSGATDIVIKNVQLIEVNRSPVTAADIALGDADIDTGYVLGTADVLNGVTDPDGDTLTIVGYAVHTGSASIVGSGPYTLTPTGEGPGTASFTISDGRGGVVTRGVTWTGLPAVAAYTYRAVPTSAGHLDTLLPLGTEYPDMVVTGSTAHGGTITITSTGARTFPGGLPTRVVFTDFSHGTVGQPVNLSAQIGAFDIAKHRGTPTFAPGGMGGRPGVYLYNHVTEEEFSVVIRNEAGHTETFVSTALRIPPGKTMGSRDDQWFVTGGVPTPGVVNTARSWFKVAWNLRDNGNLSDIIQTALVGASSEVAGNSNSTGDAASIPVTVFWDVNGGWNHLNSWVQHNAANRDLGKKWQRWTTPVADAQKSSVGPVLNDDGHDTPFNELTFVGWIEGNSLCQVVAGYAYAAFGPNAPCRIELSNKPVRARSSHAPASPPTAWSSTAVSARCNRGDLDWTKPVFANIYDSANNSVLPGGLLLNPEVV